jgi:hypothetical protein
MPEQQLAPTASAVPPLLDANGVLVESVDLADGRAIDLRTLRTRLTLEGQAVFAGKVYARVAQGEAPFWAINAASNEMSPPGYWPEKALSPEEQQRWLRSHEISATPAPALAPPTPALVPAPRARSNLGGSSRPGRRAGGSRTSRGSPRLDDPDRPPLSLRRRA